MANKKRNIGPDRFETLGRRIDNRLATPPQHPWRAAVVAVALATVGTGFLPHSLEQGQSASAETVPVKTYKDGEECRKTIGKSALAIVREDRHQAKKALEPGRPFTCRLPETDEKGRGYIVISRG